MNFNLKIHFINLTFVYPCSPPAELSRFLPISPGLGGRKNGTLIHAMPTRGSANVRKVYRLSKQTIFSYRKRQVVVSDIPIYQFIADSNFSSFLFKMANFVAILDIETMRPQEYFARKHLELQVDNFWRSTFPTECQFGELYRVAASTMF
jgi:hypothetical protein